MALTVALAVAASPVPAMDACTAPAATKLTPRAAALSAVGAAAPSACRNRRPCRSAPATLKSTSRLLLKRTSRQTRSDVNVGAVASTLPSGQGVRFRQLYEAFWKYSVGAQFGLQVFVAVTL